jgi:ubiquinone/menaquinone biosynthesis C-methylase UbiE
MAHPDWAKAYERPVELGSFVDNVCSHNDHFVEITSRRPRRVLEVGVGGGSSPVFLSHLGVEVVAVDNNSGVLDAARTVNGRLNGRMQLQSADAFNLPFEANSFDMVCHQGFFEHFDDEEIRRLTAEQL